MKDTNLQELKVRFLSLKDNVKAILAIVVFLFLLDAAVLLRAQFVSVGRLFAQASQLKTTIRTAKDDAKFLSTYQNRLKDLKAELSNLSKMTVTEENLPTVLETISKFADISVVRILKIKPLMEPKTDQKSTAKGAPKTQESFVRQKIAITAKCGFHQLGRFIALVESSPVFLEVKSIEIQTDPQEFLRQQVTIVLEVVVRKV